MSGRRYTYPLSYIIMVKRFVEETRRQCFSYNDFRVWFYRSQYRNDLEWHTVERVLRRLAEDGFLDREIRYRNRAYFCVNDRFREYLDNALKNYKPL